MLKKPGPVFGRLLIVGAAILFSTGGAGIKATALTNWQVACFRSGIAFVALLVMLPAGRRGWTRRVVAVGMAYSGALICYALANKWTTAANAIFLQSTAPIYIFMLAPWLLGEWPRRRDVVFMALLALGLVPFFASATAAVNTAPRPLAGNILGVATGVFWALTVIGLRWLGREKSGSGSLAAVVVGNLIAFLVCLPLALPVTTSAPGDWLMVSYLGAIQIGLAYVFLTAGLRVVPAFEVSLLALVELVLNPVWAWWVHGEMPGRWALAGGVLIVGAIAAQAVLAARLNQQTRSVGSSG